MNKKKNNLDEMQEQKLLKIEHTGCWLAFWGLAAAILIQQITGKGDAVGETIVLFCLAIYIVAACIKNGVWDRRLKPNLKTNLVASVIGGAVCGGIAFFQSYVQYGDLISAIFATIFVFGFAFILCFGLLMLSVRLYKKRVQDLEEKGDD